MAGKRDHFLVHQRCFPPIAATQFGEICRVRHSNAKIPLIALWHRPVGELFVAPDSESRVAVGCWHSYKRRVSHYAESLMGTSFTSHYSIRTLTADSF